MQQTAVWNDTSDGTAGGIWSPGDVMADRNGNIFVSTGKRDTSAKSGGTGYSLALVKLNGSDLSVADFFMPPNVNDLNSPDLDLAGGGFVLVPDGAGLVVGGGKDGTVYVLNGTQLGGYTADGSNIIQSLPGAVGGPNCRSDGCIFSVPAFWNNQVYYIGQWDVPKAFSWKGTLFGPTSGQRHVWRSRRSSFVDGKRFLINSLPPNGGGPLSLISNLPAAAEPH